MSWHMEKVITCDGCSRHAKLSDIAVSVAYTRRPSDDTVDLCRACEANGRYICPFANVHDMDHLCEECALAIGDRAMKKAQHTPDPCQVQANARLIAAAPDLLEACEKALAGLSAWVDDYPYGVPQEDRDLLNLLRAAIAKALGEEVGL